MRASSPRSAHNRGINRRALRIAIAIMRAPTELFDLRDEKIYDNVPYITLVAKAEVGVNEIRGWTVGRFKTLRTGRSNDLIKSPDFSVFSSINRGSLQHHSRY